MKFRGGVLFSFLFAWACAEEPAPTASYEEHMAAAREAFADEDWKTLAAAMDGAQTHRPFSLYITKNRVLAHELNGKRKKSLAIVRMIAERGLTIDLSGHDAFDALKSDSAFGDIGALMEENEKPFGDPFVIEVNEKTDLLPEAIALRDNSNFLIGGVRGGEIVPLGAIPAVIVANGGVFDMEVRANVVWAAVNNQLAYKNEDNAAPSGSVQSFDLTSALRLEEIPLGGEDTLIGDLEITRDGVMYASDSNTPRIFRVGPGDDRPTTEITDPRFVNLQGIALDEENGRLFLADYLTGLWSINLESSEAQLIANDADAHLGGIDGLYYYQGDLIGVQNGTTPHRIVRIDLSEGGTAVTGLEVLAQNLPQWNEPTHGVVHGDVFYYIATSNWPSYDAENGWAEREDNPPQPLRIMKAPLN